jgi:chemotaxis signal transduction protein
MNRRSGGCNTKLDSAWLDRVTDAPRFRTQTPLRFADKPDVQAGQYLTFRVARHDFAIEASRLRGILPARELEPVMPSPDLARFLGSWTCGFASIRGRDIPVVDLRGLLQLPHGTQGRHPCIVVVEIATPQGPSLTGFLADRVTEMIYARERDFSRGKLRLGGRLRRVLDPEILLGQAEQAPRLRAAGP